MIAQLIANSLISGAIYALIALSFAFVYGPTKIFNLAHGSFVVVGSYLYYTFLVMWGWPIFWAAAAAVVATGLLGALMAAAIFEPLRRRNASGLVYMIATLGAMTIIQSILALIYGSQYKSIPGSNEMATFTILGARVTLIQLIIFATGILACLGLMALTYWTRFGRAIVALSDSFEMSRIVGINPGRNIAWVLFIGAGLAALGGVLISYDVGVEPAMGMDLLLKGAVASIIGGMGALYGAIAGGFVLGGVENFGIWKLPVEWKSAIAFVLLLIFLIFRPQGIFKKK